MPSETAPPCGGIADVGKKKFHIASVLESICWSIRQSYPGPAWPSWSVSLVGNSIFSEQGTDNHGPWRLRRTGLFLSMLSVIIFTRKSFRGKAYTGSGEKPRAEFCRGSASKRRLR